MSVKMESNTENIVYFNKINNNYYHNVSINNEMTVGLKQPFCCSKCNFKTKFSGYLSSHMNLAHSDIIKTETITPKIKEEISTSCDVTSNKKETFFCSKCNFSTNFKYGFKIHLRSHSAQYMFTCSKCPYKTNVEYYFKIHFMNHSGKYLFRCTKCQFRTNWNDVLEIHQRKHADRYNYQCTECDYKTNKENDYKIHQDSHEVHEKFQCPECDYTTNKKVCYQIHQSTHPKYKFLCNKCDFKTNIANVFQIHTDTHSGIYEFCCDECDYKCNSKDHFRFHLILFHSIRSAKWKFNCVICPFRTNNEFSYQRHKIHHRVDNLCDIKLSTAAEIYFNSEFKNYETYFKRTVRSDIDEGKSQHPSFQCDSCNFQTNTVDFLILHEMEHTQEITYHCSECPFFTYTKKALLLHQTIYCAAKS